MFAQSRDFEHVRVDLWIDAYAYACTCIVILTYHYCKYIYFAILDALIPSPFELKHIIKYKF